MLRRSFSVLLLAVSLTGCTWLKSTWQSITGPSGDQAQIVSCAAATAALSTAVALRQEKKLPAAAIAAINNAMPEFKAFCISGGPETSGADAALSAITAAVKGLSP